MKSFVTNNIVVKAIILFLILEKGMSQASIQRYTDEEDNNLTSGTSLIKILPLGDSITWGVNIEDTNSSGYREFLYTKLVNAGYNIDFIGSVKGNGLDPDHEGHPGWEAIVPGYHGAIDTALTKFLNLNHPDIILLHIGTNDLGGGGKTAIDLAKSVKNLLDTIYYFDNNIITIVAKIIDRADSETRHIKTVDFNNNELLGIFNKLQREQQQKIILIDMYNTLGDYFSDPENPNFSDKLHPNEQGYHLMADEWYRALVSILSLPVFANIEPTSIGEFKLYQNYPNPFNPATTISFTLPINANVTIKLYNTLGQETAEILNTEMDKGVHEIFYNASGISSGMYFYRVVAKGNDGSLFAETKRMTLIK